MNSTVTKYIVSFVGLVILQAIIFNHIHFFHLGYPFPYILLIILLPININKTALLAIAFVLGISIDIFSSSGGIHTAAILPIAYFRHNLLNSVIGNVTVAEEASPNVHVLGVSKFCVYAAIVTFIHHFLVLNLEVFKFSELWHTLLKTIVSVVLSVFFMVVLQYIFIKRLDK